MSYTITQREYNINEVINEIYRLGEEFPFLDVFSIGKSVLGRPILAVKIGVRDNCIIYAGGFFRVRKAYNIDKFVVYRGFLQVDS